MNKPEGLSELASRAEELVTNLQELRQRIGHYGAAKEELRAATGALGDVTTELHSLTKQACEVLQKLDQLGAANLSSQLSVLGKRLDETHTKMDGGFANVAAKLAEASAQRTLIIRLLVVGGVLLLGLLGVSIRSLLLQG
jgi:DNA repair exonuclease SbcCD ATPase subunit